MATCKAAEKFCHGHYLFGSLAPLTQLLIEKVKKKDRS